MRENNSTPNTTEGVKVKVSRFGMATQEVIVPEDSSVADVLAKLNISISPTEKVYVESKEAQLENLVDDGDYLQIVGKSEGGNK